MSGGHVCKQIEAVDTRGDTVDGEGAHFRIALKIGLRIQPVGRF